MDRLDLLLELEVIAESLDAIEQRHGFRAVIEDARQRQQQVRVAVIAQLRALLDTTDSAAMMVH